MIQRLETARIATSPRYALPRTPLPSLIIHGGVALLWLALFASAFVFGGVYAWSTGIVYIAYDTALLAFVAWHTLALLKRSNSVAPNGSRVSAGVIVAAHNEAAVLSGTIEGLLAQDDPPDTIFIVDDGSTDGTAALLTDVFGFTQPTRGETATSGNHACLHWLPVAHGGKARALNAAIVRIDTEIVLTVDADTHLAVGAVGAMRAAFSAEPRLAAATGILAPVCGPSLAGRLFEWFQTYEYIRNFLSRYAWMRVDSLLLISGAFAGFRRDALVAVGGFDPECLVEDYELIHRMRRHATEHGLGWTTGVVPGAMARTYAPSTTRAFLMQRRRWFGGFLQTQYWYRAMVGDARYGRLGTWMLPVKAIDTMQPIYGLTALAVFFVALVEGKIDILVPVSALIITKIVIDLGFHIWSVHLYRRWVGANTEARFGLALLAALVEPFSFQILRHLGATLGWVTFMTGTRHWGKQERLGLGAPLESDE